LPAHLLTHSREELLALRTSDVIPTRSVRKSIFSHHIWQPAYERRAQNHINQTQSDLGVTTRIQEDVANPPACAAKHKPLSDEIKDDESRNGNRRSSKRATPARNYLGSLTGKAKATWISKCADRRATQRALRQTPRAPATAADTEVPWTLVSREKLRWSGELKFATWNVRTLRKSLEQNLIAADLLDKRITVVAVQECRWRDERCGEKLGGYCWYGGGAKTNHTGATVYGVAIGVHVSLATAVINYVLLGSRVVALRLKGQQGRDLVVASAYSPTEVADEQEKIAFWRDVRKALQDIGATNRDLLLVGADLNAELGSMRLDENEQEFVDAPIGPFGTGEPNRNAELALQFCGDKNLIAAASFVNRPARRKWTFHGQWQVTGNDPTVRRRREYDHVLISRQLRPRIQDVRNCRNTRLDSDHCLRLIRLDLRGVIRKPVKPEPKLSNVLRTKEAGKKVDQRIHNRFMSLADDEDELPDDVDVPAIWNGIKAEAHAVAAGEREARVARKPWVSELTLDLIDKRTNEHAKFMEKKNPTDADRTPLREARAAVRRSAKADKSKYYEQIASDVQHAHDVGAISRS